jgi:hypothetical protein
MAIRDGDMVSANRGVSIEVNTADRERCRGVYIGTSTDYDFSFDGTTWVEFQAALSGTILPIQVVGARRNAAGAAPTAGDIVFLY